MTQPVQVVDLARTPVGKFNGSLSGTLALTLAERGHGLGVATACIGVGQGLAVVMER